MMATIRKRSLQICSIARFRHSTLLFTALLLIMTNGCATGEKVDLKDRCMKYPLHLMCRGSVMKRGIPKMRNLDMMFDDFLRWKMSRSPPEWEEYIHQQSNILSRLTKKERNDLYEYYLSAKQAKRANRSKLLNTLVQSDGLETAGRLARDANYPNDANMANTSDERNLLPDNLEYK